MLIVPAVATLLTGLVAGIYLSVPIHDRRIVDLDGPAYVAMHQMRDATFRVVMPPLSITMVTVLVVSAILTMSSVSGALFACAAVASVADIVLTVRHQIPLNHEVQSWDSAYPPKHWAMVRDSWGQGHGIRLAIGILVFAATLTATLLAAAAG